MIVLYLHTLRSSKIMHALSYSSIIALRVNYCTQKIYKARLTAFVINWGRGGGADWFEGSEVL